MSTIDRSQFCLHYCECYCSEFLNGSLQLMTTWNSTCQPALLVLQQLEGKEKVTMIKDDIILIPVWVNFHLHVNIYNILSYVLLGIEEIQLPRRITWNTKDEQLMNGVARNNKITRRSNSFRGQALEQNKSPRQVNFHYIPVLFFTSFVSKLINNYGDKGTGWCFVVNNATTISIHLKKGTIVSRGG